MPAISSNKVLAYIPFIGTPSTKNKLIFSRGGKTTFLFEVKKFFMRERMQEAAAMRIKNIFDEGHCINKYNKHLALQEQAA